MEGRTHIIGGIAAGMVYLHFGGSVDEEVLLFGGVIFGAMLPDIDHTSSRIGKAVPFVDNVISSLFGHRTLTHSLLFLLLLFWLFHILSWPESLELGIMLGVLSHIILDMCTVNGVKFLWPIRVRVGVPFGISTGGSIEKIILVLLIVVIGFTGYQIYF